MHIHHHRFEVGDIAIGVKPPDKPDTYGNHGTEVVVLGGLEPRTMKDGSDRMAYLVKHEMGGQFHSLPEWLRPKVPYCWAGVPRYQFDSTPSRSTGETK